MKLRKGDQVKVLIGKDKAKVGPVIRVLPQANKVIIENVNQFKRHLKARTQGQASEIVTITKPLPVSSVALICPKCKRAARVGFEFRNNKKVRVCRKCKESID